MARPQVETFPSPLARVKTFFCNFYPVVFRPVSVPSSTGQNVVTAFEVSDDSRVSVPSSTGQNTEDMQLIWAEAKSFRPL